MSETFDLEKSFTIRRSLRDLLSCNSVMVDSEEVVAHLRHDNQDSQRCGVWFVGKSGRSSRLSNFVHVAMLSSI